MTKLILSFCMVLMTVTIAYSGTANTAGQRRVKKSSSFASQHMVKPPTGHKYHSMGKTHHDRRMQAYDRAYDRYDKEAYNGRQDSPSGHKKPLFSNIRPGRNHDNPAAYGFGDSTQVNKFIWHRKEQPSQMQHHR